MCVSPHVSRTHLVFTVSLQDLNLKDGAKPQKLTLADGRTYSGNAAKEFKEAKPFKVYGAK